MLYLLHGGGGGFNDWSDSGDLKNIVTQSGLDMIVVLVEGGRAGFYSDWQGETDGHFRPLWETFHMKQLVPWVDANFNTSRTRSQRAIAGLSMGGAGALFYAGRYSSTFGAVGSFSGASDMDDSRYEAADNHPAGVLEDGARGRVTWAVAFGGARTVDHWGDGSWQVNSYWTSYPDDDTWRMFTVMGPPSGYATKSPVDLASNYLGMKVGLYSGGQDDGKGDHQVWDNAMYLRLKALGSNSVRQCRGANGSHSFEFWKNDLRDFIGYAFGTTPSSCPNSWGTPRT